jgi:hypothetical protein
LKAVDFLTINEENRLKLKVEELTERTKEDDYIIKSKLDERDDAITTLSDQLMKVMAEVQELKKQNQSS